MGLRISAAIEKLKALRFDKNNEELNFSQLQYVAAGVVDTKATIPDDRQARRPLQNVSQRTPSQQQQVAASVVDTKTTVPDDRQARRPLQDVSQRILSPATSEVHRGRWVQLIVAALTPPPVFSDQQPIAEQQKVLSSQRISLRHHATSSEVDTRATVANDRRQRGGEYAYPKQQVRQENRVAPAGSESEGIAWTASPPQQLQLTEANYVVSHKHVIGKPSSQQVRQPHRVASAVSGTERVTSSYAQAAGKSRSTSSSEYYSYSTLPRGEVINAYGRYARKRNATASQSGSREGWH